MSIFSNRYGDAKQEAGAYTRALLELVGDRDPQAITRTMPDEVAQIVSGVSAEALRRPEAPDKWSMLQVVRHLADSEIVWAYRLRRIIAEYRPPIEGYDQDRWAKGLKYDAADLAESLAELRAVRAGNLRLVRSLDPAQLRRVGVHSERGEESIEHLLRMMAGHDLLHLRQLSRIREATRLGASA